MPGNDPQVLEKMRVLMQGEVFKYEKYFLSFQTYKAESLSYLLQGELIKGQSNSAIDCTAHTVQKN